MHVIMIHVIMFLLYFINPMSLFSSSKNALFNAKFKKLIRLGFSRSNILSICPIFIGNMKL